MDASGWPPLGYKWEVGGGGPVIHPFLCFYFTLHHYHKNTKNIILSDLTLVSDREGIDNPLSRWLRGVICFVQVLGDARATSYWIDTLVLKN